MQVFRTGGARLYRLEGPFDIVYLDPPYADPVPLQVFRLLREREFLRRMPSSSTSILPSESCRRYPGIAPCAKKSTAMSGSPSFPGNLTNGKLGRVTRAIYPGSFDPPTNGHLDVIERAARCFGEFIVAIVVNPQKRARMFSLEEREEMLRDCAALPAFRRAFSGLFADYVRSERADVIVKGLRVVSDFESEMSAALMNRSLSDVDTLFLDVRSKIFVR